MLGREYCYLNTCPPQEYREPPDWGRNKEHSPHLISSHLTSPHLTSPYLISSSLLISSHLVSSHTNLLSSCPGFGPVFTTSDSDSFWQQLNEIHALGGGDEPEMCLSAVEV
jgi:hypothetical protein